VVRSESEVAAPRLGPRVQSGRVHLKHTRRIVAIGRHDFKVLGPFGGEIVPLVDCPSDPAGAMNDVGSTSAKAAPAHGDFDALRGPRPASKLATLWLPLQWPNVSSGVRSRPHEIERPARTSSSGADRWRVFRRTYVRLLWSSLFVRTSIRKPLLYPSELRGHGRGTVADAFELRKRARVVLEAARRRLATVLSLKQRSAGARVDRAILPSHRLALSEVLHPSFRFL